MKIVEPFQGVLFDMDGLMIDTESIALAAFSKAMQEYGYTAPETAFADLIGLDNKRAETVLRRKFGDGFPFKTIYQKMVHYEHKHIREHGIALKPGIEELLMFLERHSIKKGVGTSTAKKDAIKRLTNTGLKKFFEVVVGGDEVDKGKPEPEIYLKVAACLDVRPDRCFVLEDSEPGVRSAFNGGMMPIMIPDLKPPSAATKELIHRIFPNHFAVIEFLRDTLENAQSANWESGIS